MSGFRGVDSNCQLPHFELHTVFLIRKVSFLRPQPFPSENNPLATAMVLPAILGVQFGGAQAN